jgi:hypothetical protein
MAGFRRTRPAAIEKTPHTEDHAARRVSQLVEISGIDTLYRDLYVRRALVLFAVLLPEAEYERMRGWATTVDDLLRQARLAVERDNWEQVRDLAGRVRTLRQLIQGKRSLMQLGEQVYGSHDVPIDALSADLARFVTDANPGLARTRATALLAALEESDPEWRRFYVSRRAHFEALPPRGAHIPAELGTAAAGRMTREAVRAIQMGDADLLERVAREALEGQQVVSHPGSRIRPVTQSDALPAAFSEETLYRAQNRGLRLAHAAPSEEFSEYLRCCCAWRPTIPDRPLTEDMRRAQGCTCGHPCLAAAPGTFQDTMDVLIVHPFISSAGMRYLPRFADEDVLIEDFPEDGDDTAASPLLLAPGLRRRRAVSRHEIERALLRTGPAVVEEDLGLDSLRFRLVCIPFDLYSRLGRERGWGQREQWTHFDGYQIWREGKLRAAATSVSVGSSTSAASASRTGART